MAPGLYLHPTALDRTCKSVYKPWEGCSEQKIRAASERQLRPTKDTETRRGRETNEAQSQSICIHRDARATSTTKKRIRKGPKKPDDRVTPGSANAMGPERVHTCRKPPGRPGAPPASWVAHKPVEHAVDARHHPPILG